MIAGKPGILAALEDFLGRDGTIGQCLPQPALNLGGLGLVKSNLAFGCQGFLDGDRDGFGFPLDRRAVPPILDPIGQGREGGGQVTPVVQHQDSAAGLVLPVLEEQEIRSARADVGNRSLDAVLAVRSPRLVRVTDEHDSDAETFGQPLERGKHPSQLGIAVIIDSEQVGRDRVDDQQLAIPETPGGFLDAVQVGAKTWQRLGPIVQDDGFEDVHLVEIRAG